MLLKIQALIGRSFPNNPVDRADMLGVGGNGEVPLDMGNAGQDLVHGRALMRMLLSKAQTLHHLRYVNGCCALP